MDYSLRQGEMLLKALAELPDIAKVIVATERMSKDDLRSIVLERLYVWHASKQPSGWFDVQDWLSPKPRILRGPHPSPRHCAGQNGG